MKKLAFLVFLLAWSPLLWAQVTSCPDQFKAYNSTGQEVTQFCVGQPIRFKSCLPNTQPDKEYYDFDKGNGVSFSTDTTKIFTYNQPGTYTVTQLINTGQISQKERTFVVVNTPPPVFTVTACAQNQVRVKITDTNYNNFLVDFGDGTKQNLNRGASATHQYSAGAPLKVIVTASYTGATCTRQAETTVQPLPAPTAPVLENIRITTPGNAGTLALSIKNLQPAYYYILERVVGASTTLIDTIKNPANATQTYNINNINTANPACFRLRTTDRCGSNLNVTLANICSQPLTATPGNNQVVIAWPFYREAGNLENYLLYRNGTLLQTLPANITSYTDNNVVCGTNYCYQLTAALKNNYSSVSNEACAAVTTTNAPQPGTLSSTFTPNNQVALTFKPVGSNQPKIITYQKSQQNSPFTTLTTSDKTTLTDANAGTNNGQLCYQAFFEDNCGKTSAASNTTCPVILAATLNPNGTLNLNWTNYLGMPGAPQYVLERVAANGTVLSSTPVTGNTFSQKINTTEQQQYFRIKATIGNQAEISFSNTVLVQLESKFALPTAFSPNGDGLNDLFEVKGQIYGNFRLQILNRWGQIIFESSNQQNGWDGKIKGQDAPVGVYVYSLSATDSTGKNITQTGTLTLVR
ncbi:MAG: gliding motility-associated C-terminal domain-containing protein [Adhaeribacter sp.]